MDGWVEGGSAQRLDAPRCSPVSSPPPSTHPYSNGTITAPMAQTATRRHHCATASIPNASIFELGKFAFEVSTLYPTPTPISPTFPPYSPHQNTISNAVRRSHLENYCSPVLLLQSQVSHCLHPLHSGHKRKAQSCRFPEPQHKISAAMSTT